MRINLKQIEAFIWVADLQSFRGAADRLNTTQPNISARIAALEAALGTTLMTRDAGSVQLTGKGQALLTHARRVMEAADTLVAAVGDATLVDGTLRLGVTEMIVHSWLRDYLRALKDQFPNLTVELTVDLSVNLEQALTDRTIDLALQNAPFKRATSGEIALGHYPLVWVARPGLLPQRPVKLDDLVRHPILTHARNTRLYADVAAHLALRRDLSPRLVPSSNLAACLHMTIEGMGVAALPAAMAARDIARGALTVVTYDWTPEPLHFFARFDAERAAQTVAVAANLACVTSQGYDHENLS
jgi:DNA-binding transcriptional LysR family regulator